MKQKKPELWYIDSAKAKVILFAAKSCELIIFFGGLWITLAVLNPEATGWANGIINRFFLTTLAFAVDAAFPESWIHAVLQKRQGLKTQFRWSVTIAVCMTFLVIFNIVAIVVKTLPPWVDPTLIVSRMIIGFGYVAIRETQGALSRSDTDTQIQVSESAIEFGPAIPEIYTLILIDQSMMRQKQSLDLFRIEQQRMLKQVQDVQNSVPSIDLETVRDSVLKHLQPQFEMFLKQLESVSRPVETPQLPAPETPKASVSAGVSPRPKTTVKHPVSRPVETPSEADNETVIHALLERDRGVSHRKLAAQTGIAESTVYRIRKAWLETHPDAVSIEEVETDESAI